MIRQGNHFIICIGPLDDFNPDINFNSNQTHAREASLNGVPSVSISYKLARSYLKGAVLTTLCLWKGETIGLSVTHT